MQIHPAASHHLPWFIPAPGGADVFMVVMAAVLIVAVLAIGVMFFRLHSLPERVAHRGKKLQFEIVAVLCLLALFTHVHLFWVAALLLALIDIPDFGGAFGRMAASLERIAGLASTRRTNTDDGRDAGGEIPGRKGATPTSDDSRTRPGGRKELLRA
jgi:hypothetical protein